MFYNTMFSDNRMKAQTKADYPLSVRPANIRGLPGKEYFITLKTRNCSWKEKTGGCTFCGISNPKNPTGTLLLKEAETQARENIQEYSLLEENRSSLEKVSIISTGDSVLNPSTVKPKALERILDLVSDGFRRVMEVSLESRVDMVDPETVKAAGGLIDGAFGKSIQKEITCGIETPYEGVRMKSGKGINDHQISSAAHLLSDAGWGMRVYIIYNLFESTPDARVKSLMDSVDFMAGLGLNGKASILVIRGYEPKILKGTAQFRNFSEVDDQTALREFHEAAIYSIRKGVRFEIDSTTADQEATSFAIPYSKEYFAALERYNVSLCPGALVSGKG
jgi:uncharacterized Fe-S cluster-containing MiaB family protein